ncbi:MFS transporter [Salinicola sp. DM10]|uniref:MFS transporter n=1 Tax=Salinicola sp. DM10 TaxID=2815721 RepID=UPI001E53285F|nr:MFS transporter [Salinicola sp. DM10]MCE3026580.1 MFS transporter [Salinicola sp. DM10]
MRPTAFATRSARHPRLPPTVWGLTLCQALLISGNVLLIATSPLIGARLAPSANWSTLPVALQLLGLTAATLPAGWLTARLGRKRTFVLGNLVGLVGIAACLLALVQAHFGLFNLGTFAIGMSIGVGMLYRFAALEAAPEPLRDSALSRVMAGGVVAALAGPWLAEHLRDALATPFLGSFLGLGGLYLAALGLLATLRFAPVAARATPLPPPRALGQLLRQPLLPAAIACAALGYAVMNLAMTATPLAMSHAGHDFGAVAGVIQWHMLAMFAPSFITGRLTRRLGHARMIAIGALCLLASLLCAWLTPAVWAFALGLGLLGLGWNFTFLPASAWLTTLYRSGEAPRAQAINDCAVFALTSLSALAAGPLNAWLGWQQLNLWLLPAVALLLVIALCAARATRHGS